MDKRQMPGFGLGERHHFGRGHAVTLERTRWT